MRIVSRDSPSTAVTWHTGGLAALAGQATQEFQLMKYIGGSPASGGLGAPLSDWARDGSSAELKVGDVVAWYHTNSGKVFDCAGATCTNQQFPFPSWHYGSPFRIYKSSGAAKGTVIHLGDAVYFDRMNGDVFCGTCSLGATGSNLGGLHNLQSISHFIVQTSAPTKAPTKAHTAAPTAAPTGMLRNL